MDALNRASIVVRIPSDIQSALVDAQNQIRRKAGADLVRWTPGPELVLTLVSLGEISPSQIARVSTVVSEIAPRYSATQVRLETLGGNPTNLQPRMLWIGVHDDGTLDRLTAELERAVVSAVPIEARGFQANVPIGRLKQESESSRSALGRAIRVSGVSSIGSFLVSSVELVRAAATSAGPTLVTVQSFPLVG